MSKSSQAFRTIREVADWLDVAAHVLRFWESKFPQIRPVKRAGGRRYYRPADMELVGGIKVLLHDRGLTIRGVQKMIREEGVAAVAALSPPVDLPEGPVIEAEVDAWAVDALADQAEANTALEWSRQDTVQTSLAVDGPDADPSDEDAVTEVAAVVQDVAAEFEPRFEPKVAQDAGAPFPPAAPEPAPTPEALAANAPETDETDDDDQLTAIDRLAALVAASSALRDGRIMAQRAALVALRDRMRRDPPGPAT